MRSHGHGYRSSHRESPRALLPVPVPLDGVLAATGHRPERWSAACRSRSSAEPRTALDIAVTDIPNDNGPRGQALMDGSNSKAPARSRGTASSFAVGHGYRSLPLSRMPNRFLLYWEERATVLIDSVGRASRSTPIRTSRRASKILLLDAIGLKRRREQIVAAEYGHRHIVLEIAAGDRTGSRAAYVPRRSALSNPSIRRPPYGSRSRPSFARNSRSTMRWAVRWR